MDIEVSNLVFELHNQKGVFKVCSWEKSQAPGMDFTCCNALRGNGNSNHGFKSRLKGTTKKGLLSNSDVWIGGY